jgi:aminomethyltransferase
VSSPTPHPPLKRTALFEEHRGLGARLIDFGGWEMPVQYPAGTIEEHLAVRSRVGLFDVSHMGEIEIRGREALALVQHLTTNDAAQLVDGQIQYSTMLYPNGGVVDDLLVHRLGADHYFLCVNASNDEKDTEWIRSQAKGFAATVEHVSQQYNQLAIQGPQAISLLRPLTPLDLDAIRYYWFGRGEVAGIDCLVTRTGYTGEDGFELYCPPSETLTLWRALMEAGQAYGILPCGLAARNTLRLEAKMALYGHEIDAETSPLEADLGWICKLGKGPFIGRDALIAQQNAGGLTRKLVGFEVVGKGIARDGNPVLSQGEVVGHVTSGSPAPYVRKNIGLAYLPLALTAHGTAFEIDVRGRRVEAVVVPTPFYRRPRAVPPSGTAVS